jgi:hypothetical protein
MMFLFISIICAQSLNRNLTPECLNALAQTGVKCAEACNFKGASHPWVSVASNAKYCSNKCITVQEETGNNLVSKCGKQLLFIGTDLVAKKIFGVAKAMHAIGCIPHANGGFCMTEELFPNLISKGAIAEKNETWIPASSAFAKDPETACTACATSFVSAMRKNARSFSPLEATIIKVLDKFTATCEESVESESIKDELVEAEGVKTGIKKRHGKVMIKMASIPNSISDNMIKTLLKAQLMTIQERLDRHYRRLTNLENKHFRRLRNLFEGDYYN